MRCRRSHTVATRIVGWSQDAGVSRGDWPPAHLTLVLGAETAGMLDEVGKKRRDLVNLGVASAPSLARS